MMIAAVKEFVVGLRDWGLRPAIEAGSAPEKQRMRSGRGPGY
ncbi:hypothetical protein THOM_2748 [Trachipleistophora hominis]|uniref:Uncharacterized protein n=1 Tax=Trachipleistophora hominis TaxID=72359 RepID=L7JSR5_TRAHO|nr:hypothetical protein THOM_2748 [Trachipleistophora hominis]